MADVAVQVGAVLNEKFKLEKFIAKGTFGVVYAGKDLQNHEEVAIKLESTSISILRRPRLSYEVQCYHHLKGGRGVPGLKSFADTKEFTYMVVDLLGPSLEDIFNYCNRKFSMETTARLALQMIDIIQDMHEKGFLHRDIKPENFLMGKKSDREKVYIIDFGIGKSYLEEGRHIQSSENNNLTGTARYASIGSHLGIQQSRKDDIESLGYVLMYFVKGRLPWQGIRAERKSLKYHEIMKTKMLTLHNDERLSEPALQKYYHHCNLLRFQDKPNYSYLKGLFQEVLGNSPEVNIFTNLNHSGNDEGEASSSKKASLERVFDWIDEYTKAEASARGNGSGSSSRRDRSSSETFARGNGSGSSLHAEASARGNGSGSRLSGDPSSHRSSETIARSNGSGSSLHSDRSSSERTTWRRRNQINKDHGLLKGVFKGGQV